MTTSTPHHHHDAIAKRLKRAEGHLRSILQMMEEHRPCLDLAQQLHAVEKAISQAKKILIQDHIDHCLEDAVGELNDERRRTIDEFKEITKYL
ncbi:metal resistance protein [Achromobacter xylosoxidans]|uniref:metal-sensing transcriptional repressor n=1 Tax=Achromobacter TaxID=222 RepID=UPI000970C015|nr:MULTISPECIES: metal-sensing transcriptional repressor [Achromobacter]MCH1989835.1 metal-sensing transcriptional repressor [Achromobacter xylosoxidans]MCH1992154.1 metal-sensing transcriptional repressor [Achromobacter xylosoxidans]MCH4586310.1 metal-sensing transcriptional repressor [Achromobacter xylosoxidans]OMG83085.1 metal resistance protein [Achromobacter xylosoxidans]